MANNNQNFNQNNPRQGQGGVPPVPPEPKPIVFASQQELNVFLQDFANGIEERILEKVAVQKVADNAPRPKVISLRTATLREWNGDLVLSVGKTWTEPRMSKLNPEDRSRIFCDIIVRDHESKEETIKKVDYIIFMQEANRIKVKILKQDVEDNDQTKEIVMTQNPDPMNNKTFIPEEIPLNVNVPIITASIEVAEGEWAGTKLDLPSAALNF